MRRWTRVILMLLLVLALLLVVGPYLMPIPEVEGTVPPQELADADSRFVEIEGIDVHYKVMGQGEPLLVLLHGFGSSLFSWREVMAPLAQYGTVAAFDRPAFGLTERPQAGEWQGTNPYTVDAQVQITLGLMDVLGAERAILVGNSAGGTIAVLTSLQSPDRVQALILVSPAIYEEGGTPAWMRPLFRVPQVRRLGPLVVRSLIARLEGALPTAWHDPSKITPEVLAGYKKPLQVENWDAAFWEFLSASRRVAVKDQLDRVAMPTLVVTGDDDRWVPTAQSVRLASELPNAQLVVIPNCGHVAQEECPEQFLAAAVGFLDGLP